MSDAYDAKDSGHLPHHDSSEGFDHSEPAVGQITIWVAFSVITLVVVIGALQNYFYSVWDTAVEQKVKQAPNVQVQDLRNLEAWRLSHYEYTSPGQTGVWLTLDRGKQIFLEELARGEHFYKGLPTKPEPPEDKAEDQAEGVEETPAAK